MLKKHAYNNIKLEILNLIPRGRENAVSIGFFRSMTGLSRREITDILKDLRTEYPICTTRHAPGGYWIGDKQDLRKTKLMLEHTVNTMQKTISTLEEYIEYGDDV